MPILRNAYGTLNNFTITFPNEASRDFSATTELNQLTILNLA